jgi:hypothetical protein
MASCHEWRQAGNPEVRAGAELEASVARGAGQRAGPRHEARMVELAPAWLPADRPVAALPVDGAVDDQQDR